MGRDTGECELGDQIADMAVSRGSVVGPRVPCKTGIQFPETAGFEHECLAEAVFLSRSAVADNRAFRTAFFQPVPGQDGRADSAAAEDIMAAAVSVGMTGER